MLCYAMLFYSILFLFRPSRLYNPLQEQKTPAMAKHTRRHTMKKPSEGGESGAVTHLYTFTFFFVFFLVACENCKHQSSTHNLCHQEDVSEGGESGAVTHLYTFTCFSVFFVRLVKIVNTEAARIICTTKRTSVSEANLA